MKLQGKYIPMLLLALLLVVAWQQQWWKGPRHAAPHSETASGPTVINEPMSGLDRHARLEFTRHARCRMDCRHITETEVAEILASGRVNTEKSNPEDQPCPTYALEGYSHERQHLRIIFAPCGNVTRVVTCVDLDKEWSCHCE